jgi:hypothetical protein
MMKTMSAVSGAKAGFQAFLMTTLPRTWV